MGGSGCLGGGSWLFFLTGLRASGFGVYWVVPWGMFISPSFCIREPNVDLILTNPSPPPPPPSQLIFASAPPPPPPLPKIRAHRQKVGPRAGISFIEGGGGGYS